MNGFDSVASRYDDDERANSVMEHLRARSIRQLEARLLTDLATQSAAQSGAHSPHLLEIGSGTGVEAAHLVSRGANVALVDASDALLERARTRVRDVRSNGLLGAHNIRATQLASLLPIYGRGHFDGAWSSLGPLNCDASIVPVADALAELVRPEGTVVVSVMNRWCIAETAWYAAHGQLADATRRWGGPVNASAFAGGPKDVPTWYFSPSEIVRAFDRNFRLLQSEALALLWPPTYLAPLVDRYSRLFARIEWLEQRVSRAPVLRNLGDHTLLTFRRK